MQSAICKQSCSFAQNLRVSLQGMTSFRMGECPKSQLGQNEHVAFNRRDVQASQTSGVVDGEANQAQATGDNDNLQLL